MQFLAVIGLIIIEVVIFEELEVVVSVLVVVMFSDTVTDYVLLKDELLLVDEPPEITPLALTDKQTPCTLFW